MLKMIEPDDDGIDNKNGKFGICFESVHVSINFKKYNGPDVETECGMWYCVIKEISDAYVIHIWATRNTVLKVGSGGAQMSLLDTLC